MYSGLVLTKMSGNLVGTHQKIDRVSRRHLARLIEDNSVFPSSKEILRFEGREGPDGIKRKSPAQDEPWHYYDPYDDDDQELLQIIQDHYNKLHEELTADNRERSAFEASWLAHAIVDGLTPAHHYPYEEKLSEIRKGASKETRTNIRAKLIMPGDTMSEKLKNNWQMWGPKGLFINHSGFEMGIASLVAMLSFNNAMPTERDILRMNEVGVIENFKRTSREIAEMDLYDRFLRRGWTTKLSVDIRNKLLPLIIETVTLTWYSALKDAGKLK